MNYSVVVAGTTNNTVTCAQALLDDEQFEISTILTPQPKPTGRKQVITKNPLHLFAEKHSLPTILVEKKITSETVKKLEKSTKTKPDFLLVVDFGYLIPAELLAWPKIAPLNIHPSALPKWRGSSPGQFSLLFGDTQSAVTLMIMNTELDQGSILSQYSFAIQSDWNQDKYYKKSFALISQRLAPDISKFAQGELIPTEQPIASPTPIARRLSKEDAYIAWEIILAAMKGENTTSLPSELLQKAADYHASTASLIEHAARAFDPWPQLWTRIPTAKGLQRMKILNASTANNSILKLETVQIAGQNPAKWNQVKNILEN